MTEWIDSLGDIQFVALMLGGPLAWFWILALIKLHLQKKRADLELVLADTRAKTRWVRALIRLKVWKEKNHLPMQIRLRLANQERIWYYLMLTYGNGMPMLSKQQPVTRICGMQVEQPWFEPAPGHLHYYRPN